MSGVGRPSATEAAQVLTAVVCDRRAFPDDAARELVRLLGHGLAAPESAALRHARLGLLIELVSTSDGVFVEAQSYEDVRAQRLADGEEWPTSSALSRAYGHWLVAVRAAMRFWFDGGAARVAADHSHARREPPYIAEEVVAALRRCADELCVEVVTEWEYEQWRRLCRQAARCAGLPMPRAPSLPVIRRHFGTFERARGHAAVSSRSS